MKQLLIYALLALTACENPDYEKHPCKHTTENYDDFSGFCWCDPASCRPSTYTPKRSK